MKKILSITAVFALFLFASCVPQYGDTLPGQNSVVAVGAGWKSEGGGVIDKAFTPGCNYIAASRNVDVTQMNYNTGLQYLPLNNLSVTLPKMRDVTITVNATLLVQMNSDSLVSTYKNFRTWSTKLLSIGETMTKRVLAKYDFSLSRDSSEENPLSQRFKISEEIKQEILKEFNGNYPEFKDNFILHLVFLGDISFPENIRVAMSKVAMEKYYLELAKVQKTVDVLSQEIKAEETRNDLDALGKESGTMSPALLDFLSQDLLTTLMVKSEGPVKLVISIDKHGRPTMFKGN